MKNKKNISMSILKYVYLLYFVFFISLINVAWLIYYNKIKSIIIFASCCLAFYLVNKNMIFVLGLSLVIVNIASLVNNKEGYKNKEKNDEDDDDDDDKEGFDEDDDDKEGFDEDDEGFDNNKNDIENELEKLTKKYKSKANKDDDKDEDDDEESSYMQDKALMKKIKKLDPSIFNTIKNLNSVDIDKINKTINKLTNKVKDP